MINARASSIRDESRLEINITKLFLWAAETRSGKRIRERRLEATNFELQAANENKELVARGSKLEAVSTFIF